MLPNLYYLGYLWQARAAYQRRIEGHLADSRASMSRLYVAYTGQNTGNAGFPDAMDELMLKFQMKSVRWRVYDDVLHELWGSDQPVRGS